MQLEETELGVTFVHDALPIGRHLLRHFSIAGQHRAGDRIQSVFAGVHGAVEYRATRGVVHSSPASTKERARLKVTRPRPFFWRIEEANRDVYDDDGERRAFAQDFIKGVVDLGNFGRECRAGQFRAGDQPLVIERRNSGDHRVRQVGAAMRSHGVIYTGMRLLSNCSSVRMSSLG